MQEDVQVRYAGQEQVTRGVHHAHESRAMPDMGPGVVDASIHLFGVLTSPSTTNLIIAHNKSPHI